MTVFVPLPPTATPDKYGSDPVVFDAQVQAWLAWMAAAAPLENAQNVENNALNANVNVKSSAAVAAAAAALSSANAAALITGAVLWVAGATYALGATRYSPLNQRVYRRTVAGAGTADPSADVANWAPVALDISTGLPAIRPSLLLDFANSRTVDPRITFTRASTATRFNSMGVLETVPANVPRIEFDPLTGACRGLLVEEARTNLLTYSEAFDNAVWAKTRSTIASNAGLAPDGTMTADKLVEDTTANNTHQILQAFTPAASTTYTYSVFVKTAGSPYASVQVGGFANQVAANVVYINFLTGAYTASDSTRTTVKALADGWFWVATTITTIAAPGPIQCAVYLSRDGVSSNYTGDGASGAYLWGAQLEAGAFPTSYIPTVAAQVTRAADFARLPTGGWMNPLEGAISVDSFLATPGVPNGTYSVFLGTSETTVGTPFLGIRRTSAGSYVNSSLGSTPTNGDGEQSGVMSKQAFAYKDFDFGYASNGSGWTSSAMQVPAGLAWLKIGAASGTAMGVQLIRRIACYPKRLSDAELQALTA